MSQWKPPAKYVKAAADVAGMSPVPLDRLPYTPEFDSLLEQLVCRVGPISAEQGWHLLLSARKRGLVRRRIRHRKEGAS